MRYSLTVATEEIRIPMLHSRYFFREMHWKKKGRNYLIHHSDDATQCFFFFLSFWMCYLLDTPVTLFIVCFGDSEDGESAVCMADIMGSLLANPLTGLVKSTPSKLLSFSAKSPNHEHRLKLNWHGYWFFGVCYPKRMKVRDSLQSGLSQSVRLCVAGTESWSSESFPSLYIPVWNHGTTAHRPIKLVLVIQPTRLVVCWGGSLIYS